MVSVGKAGDAFHRSRVLWTPEGINFGIDDVGYYRFPNDGRGDRATWPVDAPFYLIQNLAIGGDWGGAEALTTGPSLRGWKSTTSEFFSKTP